LTQVDPNKCIGCGLCASLAPNTFELKDGKSTVKVNAEGAEAIDTVETVTQAKDSCPAAAISL